MALASGSQVHGDYERQDRVNCSLLSSTRYGSDNVDQNRVCSFISKGSLYGNAQYKCEPLHARMHTQEHIHTTYRYERLCKTGAGRF
jgi:hypothetical protein